MRGGGRREGVDESGKERGRCVHERAEGGREVAELERCGGRGGRRFVSKLIAVLSPVNHWRLHQG